MEDLLQRSTGDVVPIHTKELSPGLVTGPQTTIANNCCGYANLV